MKRQSTWGLVGVLAIAAALGISLQPAGNRSGQTGTAELRPNGKSGSAALSKQPESATQLACDSIAAPLERFLGVDEVPEAKSCDAPGQTKGTPGIKAQAKSSSAHAAVKLNANLKFVIATLPDPLHTHVPLIFDRMTAVIQQAAQDENYLYEASWLPWENQEKTYSGLKDEDEAEERVEFREKQPGILIFRKPAQPTKPGEVAQAKGPSDALLPYRNGLIVFVVGEDPTSGIHVDQFKSALAWIRGLEPATTPAPTAILGPSFSGSFPALAKLLSTSGSDGPYDFLGTHDHRLSIYSGTANSDSAIKEFNRYSDSLYFDFHSFLERDEVGMERYCQFLKNQGYSPEKISVISEDETAYGGSGADTGENPKRCLDKSLWLYYPRDISALRSAYQTNSVFSVPATQQSSAATRNSLPNDLADPEVKEHDTIRSYAGNQTPLSQEAYLLSLVDAMKVRKSQYVILRSTNSLDELFLAQYLRRSYPDARIVIDNSDRRFEQQRNAPGMAGTMTLTTYPLLETEREWINSTIPPAGKLSLPRNPMASSPGHRSFDSDTSEGTYIALRLLLHSQALRDPNIADPCTLTFDAEINNTPTLPQLPEACGGSGVAIPDYGTPPWMMPQDCENAPSWKCRDTFRSPATWLTYLGRDGNWPIAAINENTTVKSTDRGPIAGEYLPRIPLSLLLCLISLAVFICIHTYWCSWKASFTMKPAFRTYFAGPVDLENSCDGRHRWLVSLGSMFLALLPLLAGWGCGVFDRRSFILPNRWPVLVVVILESAVALLAVVANIRRVEILRSGNGHPTWSAKGLLNYAIWLSVAAIGVALFFFGFAFPLQGLFKPANRLFTYYRSMNILSGVSPIVPFMALALGLYAWFWYSLHGLALFGSDRCRLPKRSDLEIEGLDGNKLSVLGMFSQEESGVPIERIAKPLSKDALGFGFIVLVLFIALLFTAFPVSTEVPIRSLGATLYAQLFFGCLVFCIVAMLTESWQLWSTWTNLRELLVFLDRLPLRRTLAALHGFSWGTVWGMSGNVLDVRYKLLSRQLESLGHTRATLLPVEALNPSVAVQRCIEARSCIAALAKFKREGDNDPAIADECLKILGLVRNWSAKSLSGKLDAARDCIAAKRVVILGAGSMAPCGVRECISALEEFISIETLKANVAASMCILTLDNARKRGLEFAKWYLEHYRQPDAGDFRLLREFQKSAAAAAAILLTRVLIPEWRGETNSLVLVEAKPGSGTDDARWNAPSLSEQKHIRDAEEFVCLPYLGFVQNILGRMRTIVMSILFLFVATAAAISSYPFDPRRGLAYTMLALFLVLGAVITYVYAQMHRDSTLSHVTNTNPEELGGDFWLKLAAAAVVPVMGLLTTFFPEISGFVSTWLQPGLQSIK